jgi:fructose-1,6-bisphosphatase/inositol monophosphatase family enzyme
MAAGALLVKEAGGIVIDYSGKDLNVMKSSSIIAGNIDIVKALRNEIDSVNLTIPKR